MPYSIEPVVADQSLFEKFYGKTHGPLEYREWHTQTVDARILLAEYYRLWQLVPIEFKARLTTETEVDAQILQDTTNDIGEAIKLMKAGKRVNKDQLDAIATVQSSAMESLKLNCDVIDGVLKLSFFSFIMNMQFQNIERAAREALPKIKELQRQLEKAKRKALEAKAQMVIDAGLAVLQVLVPEVTVIVRVGIAVGQWGMDKILGGDKSTKTRDTVSDVGTQMAIVQSGIQDNKWLTPGASKIVTKAGKHLTVVGLFFDHDEVTATMDRVDVAKAALDQAVAALKTIKRLLERHRPAMVQFKMQVERAARNMEDTLHTARKLRWDRMTLMSEADYRPLVRTNWKIDPDPAPQAAVLAGAGA